MSTAGDIRTAVAAALSGVDGLRESRTLYEDYPGALTDLEQRGSYAVAADRSVPLATDRRQQRDSRGWAAETVIGIRIGSRIHADTSVEDLTAHLALEALALDALWALRDAGTVGRLRLAADVRRVKPGSIYVSEMQWSVQHIYS